MPTISDGNSSCQSPRTEVDVDDLPPPVLEAAQALISAVIEDWRRHTDGAARDLDLDDIGVHFSPCDVTLSGCRQDWLLVLTDDRTLKILRSTIVPGEEALEDDAID